ncbi:MAG: lysylphosphatidylglycerol synthase domain-containing protein [Bacteroidia bacterium]|nr:lysylphosphatidylglycerol synthase domain-containing protein [Bacteroidia bacterium]
MQEAQILRKNATRFLVAVLIAGSALLLWQQLRGVSLHDVQALVSTLGYRLPLIVLPYGLVLLLDVLGWRQCMTTPRYLSLRTLFAIRVSTDALLNTIPAGVAIAEPMRIMMLHRRLRLPVADATSATLLSKMNIAIAQMLFVLLGLLLVLLHANQHQGIAALLDSAGGWVTVLPATLLVLAVLSLPYTGPRFTQLLQLLHRLPVPTLRKQLSRGERALAEIDGYIGDFARSNRARFITSLLLFLWGWLLMAAETWLLLHLLGAEVSISQAIVFEGLASIVKLLFFFIPSGIGAQDLSFVAMLFAFGVPDAATVAVAFMLLRRGKELFWAITGLGVLGFLRPGTDAHTPAQQTAMAGEAVS